MRDQVIKYGALAMLVLQNTFLVVFMRYSRTIEGPKYASSTAVFMMEVMKLITCCGVVAFEREGLTGLKNALVNEVWRQPVEMMKISVPSLVYTVQNNLLYFALTHLNAATYMVCYQLKILTTAIFSTIMLGKRISVLQWGSLVLLTIGVSLAEYSSQHANSHSTEARANTTSGFIAVIIASVLSGFAGVYFERILKGSQTTLWVRNIQMGTPSIFLALIGVFTADYKIVSEHGFFHGYSSLVWTVITLQAVGGLVVAVVVKYADNILKGFAASFSIITAIGLSYAMFHDFIPTKIFMIGAVLVNISMYLYSYVPKPSSGSSSGRFFFSGGSAGAATTLKKQAAGALTGSSILLIPKDKVESA